MRGYWEKMDIGTCRFEASAEWAAEVGAATGLCFSVISLENVLIRRDFLEMPHGNQRIKGKAGTTSLWHRRNQMTDPRQEFRVSFDFIVIVSRENQIHVEHLDR